MSYYSLKTKSLLGAGLKEMFMENISLNCNKERKACWEMLLSRHGIDEVEKAILTLKKDTQIVIRLYCFHQYSFHEVATEIDRSISIVRNHYNRGIYKLYRYFNPRRIENK